MAEQTSRERLQPCLLDRLTDDDPGSQVESRDKRVMSPSQVKKAVLRDLGWLFNTSAPLDSSIRPPEVPGDDPHYEREEAPEFPRVHRSVVNFGVADFCGQTSTSLKAADMEKRILEAISRYEPRVFRRGLIVRAILDKDAYSHNALLFEIQGQVWAQPIPERLDVKTEVDLETGTVSVYERSAGSAGSAAPSPPISGGPGTEARRG